MYMFLSRNVVSKHLWYLTSYAEIEYKKSCGSKHTDINVCLILMKTITCWHTNTHKYKISWNSVQWFSSCYMLMDGDRQTDRQTDMVKLSELLTTYFLSVPLIYTLPPFHQICKHDPSIPATNWHTCSYNNSCILTNRYSYMDWCIAENNRIIYTDISQLGVCKFRRFFSQVPHLILVLLSSVIQKLLFL
jgi:hypothetical protein